MSIADTAAPHPAVEQVTRARTALAGVRASIARAIIGQDDVVELALGAILTGGHALLVGEPGLAKTKLVQTIAVAMGLDAKRIQFTPDLMPDDILGSEVLEQSREGVKAFRYIQGPVFCQLLMADEINRASPKTQAALLQAMQERFVTVAGQRYDLPRPFHVLATQNPIEQEGTYPLPEAQLDRFVYQIDVKHPTLDEEREILRATTQGIEREAEPVMTADELRAAQALVRDMPTPERVVDAILTVVRQARPSSTDLPEIRDGLAWGPGPRAGQALMLGVRARALLRRETGDPSQTPFAPDVEDVKALAAPVLRHRVAPSFAARAQGVTADDLIARVVAEVR